MVSEVVSKDGINIKTKPVRHRRLRWDKADKDGYYSATYHHSSSIDAVNFGGQKFSVTDIYFLGGKIVNCLKTSAAGQVPVTYGKLINIWGMQMMY
jgi:hypothetical protein